MLGDGIVSFGVCSGSACVLRKLNASAKTVCGSVTLSATFIAGGA